MRFYHFLPVTALQALMRGELLKPIPTLCPTSNLIDYGVLTFYCEYERPNTYPLSQEAGLGEEVVDPDYFKLCFEEGMRQNSFTLGRFMKKEREQFLKNEQIPKGASLVLRMPGAWKRRQNRSLTGGTLVLVMDSLVTIFQNNLMQVINPKSPNNAQLYPNGKSKLEPAANIYAYAPVYLKGYQKRFARVLNDPHHTALNLMNAKTREGFRREQVFVLTLETITKLLGGLVDSYKQNQVPKELEERIVREISVLSKDTLDNL